MDRRQLEYVDGKSNKFWNIELSGSSHTVHYGRIGTAGQTKTKEFSSAEEARASYEKLLEQKLKKGYVDAKPSAAAPQAPKETSSGGLPLTAFHSVKSSDDIGSNVTSFAGKSVVDYKADASGDVIRFRSEWEQNNFKPDLETFLASDAALTTKGIVIGMWSDEMYESDSGYVIEILVEHKNRLPNLTCMYLGDIVAEENEMSWINQSDISPLLASFPNLEYLRVRGGTSLGMSNPKHSNLRALALETGGMGVEVVRSVCTSQFPKLEHLELWLGTEEYGGNSTVQDLQPLFTGNLFPNLKYLGLRNCDYVDNICPVLVNSPIIERIETLDLSLGALSDTGGQALLKLPTDKNLKCVDLYYHYLSAEMMKKLQDMRLDVDVSDSQEEDDEWRFVAVGE